MTKKYNLSHWLIVCGLLLSLFLQSCGNSFNQFTPQEKEQPKRKIELSDNTLINTDKEIVTVGGYLPSFYEEDGKLKADLKADENQSNPNYKGVPVWFEEGTDLASLTKLDPITQQNRIELKRSHSGQLRHITICKGGLSGGMKRSIINKGDEDQEGEKEQEIDFKHSVKHTTNNSLDSSNKAKEFITKEDCLKLQPLISVTINPEKVPMQELMKLYEIKEVEFWEKQVKETLESATEVLEGKCGLKERYKIFGQFIICAQNLPMNESAWPGNLPDLKKRTMVEFNDNGLLYQNNSILDSSEEGLWALNSKGKMCIFFQDRHPDINGQVHHSFFFKKGGSGKPIACGGIISVCKGKIMKINNDSGRYMPSDPQLMLAAKYLFNKGVLDPTVRIQTVSLKDTIFTLKEMLIIAHSLALT